MTHLQKNPALTFVETVIVLAMFMLLIAYTVPQVINLMFRNQLEVAGQEIVHVLRRAQAQASQQVHDSAWGVAFDASGGTYTYFAGTGYEARNPNFDLLYDVTKGVSITSLSLADSGTAVIFDQISGDTSQYGTISLLGADNDTRTITITRYGSLASN